MTEDPGFWWLIGATLAAGIAVGVTCSLIYLAGKHQRQQYEPDPVWAEFHRTGVQPRTHRRPFRAL